MSCSPRHRADRKPARLARALVATMVGVVTLLAVQPADARPTHPQTFKPCQYEDGPAPCVWDAKHRGNGKGTSFILRKPDRYVYVSHATAHRLTRNGI